MAEQTIPLVITGNPRTFRGKGDLTTETFDTICTLLEQACESLTFMYQRPWRAAAEVISQVGGLARRAGWDEPAILRLEAAAGVVCAEIISEAVADAHGTQF